MKKTLIKILLIEDNPADALLLQEALGRDALSSFQCTQAARLKDGLEQLQRSHFDAVLLDLGLPDSQGMETFERACQQVHGTPILILSGLADEQLSVSAVQAGAQDYLVKSPAGWEQAPRAIRHAIERQRLREALSESERQYRELFENTVLGTFKVTADGKPVAVNPAFARMFGYASPEEFLGLVQNTAEIFADPQRRAEILRIRTGNPSQNVFENVYRRKDGSTFYGNLTIQEVVNQDGRISLLEGFIEDITERKRAEEALARAAAEWQKTFDATTDGIYLLDKDQRFIRANKALGKLLNIETKNLPGKFCWQVVHGTSAPPPDCPMMCACKSGKQERQVYKIGERWFECLFDPIFTAEGEFDGGVHIIRDITERKRVEDQIAQQLDELQRWYNMTIDRESRSLELKREINDLLRRLNEPIRYYSAEK